MAQPEAYITPLDGPPPWRDGASAKPLTVYTVNHPASLVATVGCTGFGGSEVIGDGVGRPRDV